MSPVPADVFLIQFKLVPLPAPRSGYEFQFVPGPDAPQPAIYFTEPGIARTPGRHRRVRWELLGPIPADHYIKITPKAYNSLIFVGPAPKGTTNDEKREGEKFLLDDTTREATTNEPLRGPKLNLGLAWYYGLHLYSKLGKPESIARFPPPVVDATEGQEITYLDPVVVIKDDGPGP